MQLKSKHIPVEIFATEASLEMLMRVKMTANKASGSDMNVEQYDMSCINYKIVTKDDKHYCFTLCCIVCNINDENLQQLYFVKPVIYDVNYNAIEQYGWISIGCSKSIRTRTGEAFLGEEKLPVYGDRVQLYQRVYSDGKLSGFEATKGAIRLRITMISRYIKDEVFREHCEEQFMQLMLQDECLMEALTSLGF